MARYEIQILDQNDQPVPITGFPYQTDDRVLADDVYELVCDLVDYIADASEYRTYQVDTDTNIRLRPFISSYYEDKYGDNNEQ